MQKIILEPVILGSGSPRRKEILSYFSLPFIQKSSDFDEESIPFEQDPEKYVTTIARGKAEALARAFPEDIILTADTTVFCEGKIYNKPRSEEEACEAINSLVGRWHLVYTGVVVRQNEREYYQAEGSRVLFNQLNKEQVRHYISKTRWQDKAGGYAIQMAGGLLVRKIDGCYYNILGLPINTLEWLLKHVGIELWDYL